MKHCITEALESRRLFALAGSFDTSFSFDGRQTIDISGRDDYAEDILVQPDGKVVVAGSTSKRDSGAPDSDYWIARYTTAGVLDTSFSGDGVQFISSATQGSLSAISLTSDGKIVLVGDYALNKTDPHAFVARLHSNGTFDKGFAGDGFYVLPAEPRVYGFSDVTVQKDNKIVAVGHGEDGVAIARYNVDGTPDINFGVGGLRLMAVGSRFNHANAVQVQTDGKIVVAGTANDYGMYENMFVARLKDDGRNDTSFNGYGINILDDGHSDRGTSLALSGDSIFVGGNGYNDKATIWKFDDNGKPSQDFGIHGRWSGDSGVVTDLVVQNTGKIVWTGGAVKLGRVASNGSTDASFQSSAFTLPFLELQRSKALAKYGEDKVVVAGLGETINDNWDGLVGRYHAGSVPNAPTIEWSSATSTTSFQLKWKDNSVNESSFTIQRSTDPTFATGVQKEVTSANVSVITFNNLAAGSKQYYRVRANNLTGSSPWTTVGSITLPGVGTTHHINAGGGAYTDSQGRNYIPDTGFSGGTISSNPFDIPNTANDPLYYDRRWGSNFSFAQVVPNGTYNVTLNFYDPDKQLGQRVFDVFAENQIKLSDLDIVKLAGQKRALTRTFQIFVADGSLNLKFVGVVGNATVSGVSIAPQT